MIKVPVKKNQWGYWDIYLPGNSFLLGTKDCYERNFRVAQCCWLYPYDVDDILCVMLWDVKPDRLDAEQVKFFQRQMLEKAV